jgi:hypothetical protein
MAAGPAVSVSGCRVQYWPCSLLFRAVPHIRMVLRLSQRHLAQRFPTFPSLTSPTSLQYQNGPTDKILHESQDAQWKETRVSHNRCKGINILLLQYFYYVPSLQRDSTMCIYSGRLLRSTTESFNIARLCFILNRPRHGTNGYSPDSHCGDSGLIPGQCMWGSYWTKWHWGRVFSEYFAFPLSVSFHKCSIFIFIYMSLFPDGQTGEAWEPSKKTMLFRKSRSNGWRSTWTFSSLKG